MQAVKAHAAAVKCSDLLGFDFPIASTLFQQSGKPSEAVLASLTLSASSLPQNTTTIPQHQRITLVVDVSGSMSNVMPYVRQTVQLVADHLTPDSHLAVVLFESTSSILLPLTRVEDISEEAFAAVLENLFTRGGTNIKAGLEKALDVILSNHEPVVSDVDPPATELLQSSAVEEPSVDFELSVVHSTAEQPITNRLFLLSDGCCSHSSAELIEYITSRVPPMFPLSFTSLGFGEFHQADLLSELTLTGSVPGSYYVLTSDMDVPSAVGDALGSAEAAVRQVIVRVESEVFNAQILDPQGMGTLSELTIPHLSEGEYHTVLLTVEAPVESFTSRLPVRLTVDYSLPHHEQERHHLTCSQLSLASPTSHDFAHTCAHLLRFHTSRLLLRLCDPSAGSNPEILLPHLTNLHSTILHCLSLTEDTGSLDGTELETSIRDEGMLQQLERDVAQALSRCEALVEGEALRSRARMLSSGQLGCHDLMMLTQLAREHQLQRTAGAASSGMRNAYTTQRQLAMRLRFLQDFKTGDLPEQAITPVSTAATAQAEREYTCFVSLQTYSECPIGLGLVVFPRTSRERRRGLVPQCELVMDYLSADGFNQGVRTMIERGQTALDRDADHGEETDQFMFPDMMEETVADRKEHIMVTGSARTRINGWLPLYISREHWNVARHLAPSAFSIIATQCNDHFEPMHALRVCARLMCAMVVRFTVHDRGASERALQMYCGVHRLFLAMAEWNPEVLTAAEDALTRFIEFPAHRTRTETPDLGVLVQYLAISDKYSWKDVRSAYVMEMTRRQAVRLGRLNVHTLKPVKELADVWAERLEPGHVTLFSIKFLEIVTQGGSTTEMKRRYDESFGVCSQDLLQQLKREIARLDGFKVKHSVNELLGVPIDSDNDEEIAELLLWSIENASKEKGVVYDGLGGSGWRVAEWKCMAPVHAQISFQQNFQSPGQELEENLREAFEKVTLTGIGSLATELIGAGQVEITPDSCRGCVRVQCDCVSCQKSKTTQEALRNWQARHSAHTLTPDPAAPRTLFLRGISPKTDVSEPALHTGISQFLEECRIEGAARDITVSCPVNPRGRGKGHAMVVFQNVSSMALVLNQINTNHGGCLLSGHGVDLLSEARRSESIGVIGDVLRGQLDPNFIPSTFGTALQGKETALQGKETFEPSRIPVVERTSHANPSECPEWIIQGNHSSLSGRGRSGTAVETVSLNQPGDCTPAMHGPTLHSAHVESGAAWVEAECAAMGWRRTFVLCAGHSIEHSHDMHLGQTSIRLRYMGLASQVSIVKGE